MPRTRPLTWELPADFTLTDLIAETREGDWQERALCAQTDPTVFHPEKGESTWPAKQICQQCDVKDECLKYALEINAPWGIWGGLSQQERRLLKARGVAPGPSPKVVARMKRDEMIRDLHLRQCLSSAEIELLTGHSRNIVNRALVKIRPEREAA